MDTNAVVKDMVQEMNLEDVVNDLPKKKIKINKKSIENGFMLGLMALGCWKAAELTIKVSKKIFKKKEKDEDEFLTVSEEEIGYEEDEKN